MLLSASRNENANAGDAVFPWLYDQHMASIADLVARGWQIARNQRTGFLFSCSLEIIKQLLPGHSAFGGLLDGSEVSCWGLARSHPLLNGLVFDTNKAGEL